MICTTHTCKKWHQCARWTRASIMFSVVILLFGIGGYAAAAEDEESNVLEEILVTATKTGVSKLQDTPISISAFTLWAQNSVGFCNLRIFYNIFLRAQNDLPSDKVYER